MRPLPEWIGTSDDSKVPVRVRLRVFARYDGLCHLCNQPIQTGQKWDLDHVKALINGGENRESNLKPAHRKCHVDKTKLDVAEKAKVSAVRMKHIGATLPKQKIPSRPKPEKRAPKYDLPPLAPKILFAQKEAQHAK